MKSLEINKNLKPKVNMESLMTKWIQYIDASNKTIETYTRAIKQFINYLNYKGIKNPIREDVIAYREELKKNHKPTTVQMYITAVKLFFCWAENEGLYKNIAEHIKGAKIDAGYKKDYLTSEQCKELLSSIEMNNEENARDEAMISIMITTGLRCISIRNADIKDIQTLGNYKVLYYKGKGHDEKTIFVKLAPQVEKILRIYLNNYRNELDPNAPLFSSCSDRNKGKRLTTISISRIVKTRLRNIGLDSERLTAHSLRHSCGSLNLSLGGTLMETQQLLDHENINTTLIYSHSLERVNNPSEIRIANAIFEGDIK